MANYHVQIDGGVYTNFPPPATRVEGVDSIQDDDGVLYFTAKDGEPLLIVPVTRLGYVKRLAD